MTRQLDLFEDTGVDAPRLRRPRRRRRPSLAKLDVAAARKAWLRYLRQVDAAPRTEA